MLKQQLAVLAQQHNKPLEIKSQGDVYDEINFMHQTRNSTVFGLLPRKL